MQESEEAEVLHTKGEPGPPFEELERTAPILAGKLARMSPEQLEQILQRKNIVRPL